MKKYLLAAATIAAASAFDASADIRINLPSDSGLDSLIVMKAPLLKFVNATNRAEQGLVPSIIPVESNTAVIPTGGGEDSEYVWIRLGDEVNTSVVAGPSEELLIDVKSFSPYKASYSGTPLMEAITELDELTAPIVENYRQLAMAEEKDDKAMEAAITEYNNAVKEYIEENISSPKVTYAITRLQGEDFVNAFNRLSERAKTSVYYPVAEKINEQTLQMLEKERQQKEIQDGHHAAPQFSLFDLEGKKVSLSEFKGKWVILDFWGSWCIWCIKGFPELKDAYAKYKDRLEIIGIDCNETEEAWRAGVKKYELPWVNVYCPKGNPVLMEYGIEAFPTKAIIDPDGNIRNITTGHDPKFFTILEDLMSK